MGAPAVVKQLAALVSDIPTWTMMGTADGRTPPPCGRKRHRGAGDTEVHWGGADKNGASRCKANPPGRHFHFGGSIEPTVAWEETKGKGLGMAHYLGSVPWPECEGGMDRVLSLPVGTEAERCGGRSSPRDVCDGPPP